MWSPSNMNIWSWTTEQTRKGPPFQEARSRYSATTSFCFTLIPLAQHVSEPYDMSKPDCDGT
jgi:hypothetical protein